MATNSPELNIVDDEVHYCEVHPDRETSLRCNKCGRYMCAQCAVSTPVGYRCQQCVRQLEDKFYTAGSNDNVVLFGTMTGLSAVATGIVSYIGLWLILIIFISIAVGGALSELARRVVQKRRGRNFPAVAAGGVVIGGLVGAVLALTLRVGGFPPFELITAYLTSNFTVLIFVGIVAVTVYGRMRM